MMSSEPNVAENQNTETVGGAEAAANTDAVKTAEIVDHASVEEPKAEKNEDGPKAKERKKQKAKAAKEPPSKTIRVADQSGRRKSKHADARRLIGFTQLPSDLKSEAEGLLERGFTFEETTEWTNERLQRQQPDDPEAVTLASVQDHFRSSFDLQGRRVRYMQKMALELKKHLIGNPQSGLRDLADAVFLTGIMGLANAGARFSVKDAAGHYVARLRLDQQERTAAVQLKTEVLKQKGLREKLEGLKRAFRRESGRRRLGPDTLRKIQEIYGLIERSRQEPEAIGDQAVEVGRPLPAASDEKPWKGETT